MNKQNLALVVHTVQSGRIIGSHTIPLIVGDDETVEQAVIRTGRNHQLCIGISERTLMQARNLDRCSG